MCCSLTSALQSRLQRRGVDVVRRDRPQFPRHAPPSHLSNAERAFHREFDITQYRYNPRTGAFERVPEQRPTPIVPPRKQRRASWCSPGDWNRRGSSGTPSTPRPGQNPRRRDSHAEDVEDRRRCREEQARRRARRNQSPRQSHAQQYRRHPHCGTSATYFPCSSGSGNIDIEHRSPDPRPSTSHGYRSPSPSPSPHSPSCPQSPPFPSPGYERELDRTDDDWEADTARSRRGVRFASFDESRSGRTYDGADVLERTPRDGGR